MQTFTRAHRCFPEALQFFVHYAAMSELMRIPFMDDQIRIAGPRDFTDVTVLHDVGSTLEFLRGGAEPTAFRFSCSSRRVPLAGDDFGTPAEPDDTVYTLPAGRAGASLCVYLLGAAWERHAKDVQRQLPQKPDHRASLPDWPKDAAFFFHLRNACFHGGTFSIKSGHMPAAPRPGWPDPWPEWHRHKIDDVSKFNSRPIFGPAGILSVADVLPLLWDMGNAIDRIIGALRHDDE